MFFNKYVKKKSLHKKLDLIRKDSSILFEMNIIRNGVINLQVFRQVVAQSFGLAIEDKEGYMILFVFDPKHIQYESHIQCFESSKYFNDIKYGMYESTKFAILFCKSDFDLLNSKINDIQDTIFLYKKKEKYSVEVNIFNT